MCSIADILFLDVCLSLHVQNDLIIISLNSWDQTKQRSPIPLPSWYLSSLHFTFTTSSPYSLIRYPRLNYQHTSPCLRLCFQGKVKDKTNLDESQSCENERESLLGRGNGKFLESYFNHYRPKLSQCPIAMPERNNKKKKLCHEGTLGTIWVYRSLIAIVGNFKIIC